MNPVLMHKLQEQKNAKRGPKRQGSGTGKSGGLARLGLVVNKPETGAAAGKTKQQQLDELANLNVTADSYGGYSSGKSAGTPGTSTKSGRPSGCASEGDSTAQRKSSLQLNENISAKL